MYKLIALDIDGTLLNKDKKISPKTIKAIKAVSETCKIVLISSRMPNAMRYLQENLGITDMPLIAFNGGLVLHGKEILFHTGIDFQTFRSVLDLNTDLNLHLSLYHNDEWYVPQQDYWSKREVSNTKVEPVIKSNKSVYEDWKPYNKEPHKIMCMGDERKVEEFYQILNQKQNGNLHLYRSKPTYIEMAPQAISKLSGLEVLISKVYPDIRLEDILAYGDNFNDVEMIDNVGLGVAVENAKNEVKAVADEITSSNLNDGVAVHLQKIFDLKF